MLLGIVDVQIHLISGLLGNADVQNHLISGLLTVNSRSVLVVRATLMNVDLWVPEADHQIARPPATAIAQISRASVTAGFQLVVLASVKSDGRLTAGPAISSVSAAPSGAPAAMRPRASGISKKVGKANGTATAAVTVTARI